MFCDKNIVEGLGLIVYFFIFVCIFVLYFGIRGIKSDFIGLYVKG